MCEDDKKLMQLEEICKAVDQLRADNIYLKTRVAALEAGISQSWDFIFGTECKQSK